MPALITNNASSTLQSSINNSDTTITVAAGEGALFPVTSATDFFYVTLADSSKNLEIVKVTTRAGDVFTVERAQDNTTARAYSAGDRVSARPVAALINEKVVQEDIETYTNAKVAADIATLTSSTITPIATDLSDHEAESTAAHAASAISFAPAGDIVATDTQSAIVELDTEKVPYTGGTFTGAVEVPDDAYDESTWDGNNEVPTKNAVRDKIAALEDQTTPGTIDKVISGGYNGALVLAEGKLYAIAGTVVSYHAYITGLGSTNNPWIRTTNEATHVPLQNKTVANAGCIDNGNAWALTDASELYAWGYNEHGQCGQGTTSQVEFPTLVDTDVAEVYSAEQGLGAVFSDGRLVYRKTDGWIYACGYNNYGQLGLGNNTDQTSPVQLTAFGQNPTSVWNMGSAYGCLVVEDSSGDVLVAGYNGYGQLGDGTTTNRDTPTNVTASWKNGNTGYSLAQVDGHFGHRGASSNAAYSAMAMRIDDGGLGFIKTAGYGGDGVLGNGSTGNVSTPHQTTFANTITDMVVMGGLGPCFALLDNGDLYAWGRNAEGQCGVGNTSAVNSPTLAESSVHSIVSRHFDLYQYGYRSAVFIRKTSGEIWSTGHNASGELCNGGVVDRSSFARCFLSDFTNDSTDPIKQITMGSTTAGGPTFFCLTEGNLLCAWGYNGHAFINYSANSQVKGPYKFKLP